jgi:thiamine-phosphate pyrophosphorylase
MLIVITNPRSVFNEAATINEMFEEGLELLHLRKPSASEEKLRNLLAAIDPKNYDKIALHQYHKIAPDFGIKRLHFREKKRLRWLKEKTPIDSRLKELTSVLSTSVHSVKDYKNLSREFDYAFLGPVFNSLSKMGYSSVIKKDTRLQQVKTSIKLIALGGVSEENIGEASEMGFDGVAVLGAIWKSYTNATKRFILLKKHADKAFHSTVNSGV